MFSQLYRRVTGAVMAAAAVSVIATGTACTINAVNDYQNSFTSTMEGISKSDLPASVRYILTSDTEDDAKLAMLDKEIGHRAGIMGIGDSRACFVLSARDASVIFSSEANATSLSITPNISAAMRAAKGNESSLRGDFLDYALFIKNGDSAADGYILYIRDNKAEIYSMLKNNAACTAGALLVCIIAAAAIGFFVAGKTAVPIKKLTKRAEAFADGNFEPELSKQPKGEIGELTSAFNNMGRVMNGTINQVSAEKHKIEVILEHINSGIIAFDTDQNVVHINTAAKKMFNIQDPREIKFDKFVRAQKANVCMAEFLYLERSKIEVRDLLIENSHVKAYFVPFKMDDKKTAGVVCMFEDVTEQFNLEAARQKFVAEVSHELKTPLTTIRTYTETLLNGYLDDKKTASRLLETIQDETDKMTALVQNLLILSRFDARNVESRKELFSVDELLHSLKNMFDIEAEQKGLSLEYNRTTELPCIYADRYQIERALKNIISNSIKYCSKGDKIKIFAGSLYSNVYIKVEDSGKGIPKADLEHVFERFYRVDKARSRERGGTGLGLPISKEIIENHGGTIQIESEFGSFTRVTVNLPINKDE